ncbi:hemin uptake protein HemP [Allorhodopirellula heiligendammensis]|uniref:Hemin uptake protein hemP n=1 Tax=Allorhodopirellula heiligendammensis TaxID=2714739 RepID=A0A5C6BVI2_9BACT|nr:hemin uptake protein HemP [Allorhodopirellula heiligendammensis]TWU16283.1 hypothetical protein Poly21_34880 [Allorhodopirellula heiligendammensis]
MDSTPPTSQSTDAAMATNAPADAGSVTSATESAVIETRVMGSLPGDNPVDCGCGAGHTLKVVRFESLARCGEEIWIENDGQLYRLRKTRQGKLILTK